MGTYPRCRYRKSDHPDGFESAMVHSAEEEKAQGPGWHDSPAEFGIETAPGVKPDPVIQSKRSKHKDTTSAVIQRPAEDPGSQARSPHEPQPGTQAASAISAGPDDSQLEPKKPSRRGKP